MPLFATDTAYEQDLRAAEAWVAAEGGPEPPCWRRLSEGAGGVDRRWGARAYAAKRDVDLKEEQAARAALDIHAAARVESCSGPGAAWLGSTIDYGDGCVELPPAVAVQGPEMAHPSGRSDRPAVDSFLISDDAAKALVRFRLGLFRGGGRCGRKTSDPKAKKPVCDCFNATARHRVQCACGPWTRWRHDRVARLLQMLILEIPGATVRWVPRAGFWPQGAAAGEPDLRVDIPGWEPLYIDVAVVWPTSTTPGRMAKAEEASKERKYPVWCVEARVQPVDFSPCVLESFGRFGPKSARLIRRLAAESAAAWGVSPAVEQRRWFSLLGRRLQIDVADTLLNGCSAS